MSTLQKWISRLVACSAGVLLVVLMLDSNAETWTWPTSDPSMPSPEPRRDATPGSLWMERLQQPAPDTTLWIFTAAAALAVGAGFLNFIKGSNAFWVRSLTLVLVTAPVLGVPLILFQKAEEHAYNLASPISETMLLNQIWLTYYLSFAAFILVIALQFLPLGTHESQGKPK